MSQWVSVYRACQEDRIHHFKCRSVGIGSGQLHCGWTTLNTGKHAFLFNCPKNGFIKEVLSLFDKVSKDRGYCACFSRGGGGGGLLPYIGMCGPKGYGV